MNYNQPRNLHYCETNHGKNYMINKMFVCSSYQSVPYLLAAQHWPPRSRRDPYWTFDLLLFSGWWVHSRTPGGIPIYTHQIQSNPQASINKTSTHTQNKKIYQTHPQKKHMQFTSFPIVYQKINKNIFPSTSKNRTRTLKASCFSTVRSKADRAKAESNKRSRISWKLASPRLSKNQLGGEYGLQLSER